MCLWERQNVAYGMVEDNRFLQTVVSLNISVLLRLQLWSQTHSIPHAPTLGK